MKTPNVELTGSRAGSSPLSPEIEANGVERRVGGAAKKEDVFESYPIDPTEFKKVMDEINELSASLGLGEFVFKELVNLRESGSGLVKLVRDFGPTMVASEKNIVFRLHPSDGLIGVLCAIRAKNRERQ